MNGPLAAPSRLDRRRRALGSALALAPIGWLAGCGELTLPAPPGSPRTTEPGSRAGQVPPGELPPPEPREFRAAWVASVNHIDWPSRAARDPDAQRAEAIAILDRARAIGLNALVLQVRPAGDALYPSRLEPWSELLAGEQGRAPEPPWDPLAFWLREAHRRALELHAWINPYRARHATAVSPPAAPHLALRAPAAVKRYGESLWMDPGEPAAFAHTLAVAEDLLARYDVDGLHIDDYFYPYPVHAGGVEQPFPDDDSYRRYRAGGGLLAREDWRRANVDALVQALHAAVRRLRPLARLGISPFGLGRPDRRPPGITGFSQYDKLYADVERWLDQGWLDYLAPQLYWPIDRAGQAFPVLLDYWAAANTQRRHLWPGLFTSAVRTGPAEPAGPRAWPAREVIDQVALVAARRPVVSGHIHYSMTALQQDRDGVASLLQRGPYAQAALPPATPWLGEPAPAAPRLLRRGADAVIAPTTAGAALRHAVWRRRDGRWRLAVHGAGEHVVAREGADSMVVSAIGRTGVAGPRAILRFA